MTHRFLGRHLIQSARMQKSWWNLE